MKKRLLLLLLVTVPFCFPCRAENPGAPVEQPAQILKNSNNFLYYWGANVKLTEDFKGFDQSGHPITKGAFLKQLLTSRYLPLRLASNNGAFYYKLYKLKPKDATQYGDAVMGWASVVYPEYEREGKKFPAFKYVDLNGKVYTPQTTKGKILVVKCWFVHCSTCVAEMPDLNQLLADYKNRKDIVFVSLAYDTEPQLKAFLKKTRFDYPVAHVPSRYFSKTINVSIFPTHFIINKQGYISKVVSQADELKSALAKETTKKI